MSGIKETFIGKLAFLKSRYPRKWCLGMVGKKIPIRINYRNKVWDTHTNTYIHICS